MMTQAITFRPITDEDLPLLQRIYASTRADEMAVVPWSEEEKADFLGMQFHAQHAHYQEHFADARFELILIDSAPVGRLYVQRRDDEIRVVDIALLPEHRGGGIGGGIMQELLDEARTVGKPVRIHVEHNNPAMRLYQRLGFKKIDDLGVYHLMEWKQ